MRRWEAHNGLVIINMVLAKESENPRLDFIYMYTLYIYDTFGISPNNRFLGKKKLNIVCQKGGVGGCSFGFQVMIAAPWGRYSREEDLLREGRASH